MSEKHEKRINEMLLPLFGLECQSVSISGHGALQLGFGLQHSAIVAGKFHKNRFEWELGCYLPIWSYIDNGVVVASGDMPAIGAERMSSILASKIRIERVITTGPVFTLALSSNRKIVFDGAAVADDEIIYIHGPGNLEIFSHSAKGWFLDSSTCDQDFVEL